MELLLQPQNVLLPPDPGHHRGDARGPGDALCQGCTSALVPDENSRVGGGIPMCLHQGPGVSRR